MFLPCSTEAERADLILTSETIEKYGYDPSSLGRHSGQMVVFKCIVCSLPFDNTKKKVLDKKGLTHPGECRLIVRKDAGQRSRQLEDPKHKEVRKERLREKIAKDKESIVSKRQKTLIDKYGSKNLSEIESIRQNISRGVSQAYQEKGKNIIESRQQTNINLYGSSNFLTSERGLQDLIQKNQTKLGVNYPFQNKEFQAKARQEYTTQSGFQNPSNDPQVNAKREDTNIKKGFIYVLSSGERVSDYCTRKNIKHSNAFKILREFGEEAFLHYVESGPSTSSLEILLIKMLKDDLSAIRHYNQRPIETSNISYKPDFRVEIDKKTLYINVDGLYWHSELEKDNSYHLKIRQVFNDHKLFIMQFREDEIVSKAPIVKSIILNYLGIHQQKYAARSCEVREVSRTTADLFLRENHLMGSMSATYFGLFNNHELVCMLGVRYNNDILEIARFGSKNFCSVRGGFSKLLNHVIKKYNPNTVVSFCDLRYATGKSYEKLGFTRVSTTLGWQWTDFNSTFNRRRCRANMDERKLSEKQYADELGWVKIYDAGQAKYVKHLKK